MSEIKVGQFYIYRDEDQNAIAIARMAVGPSGGRFGEFWAYMATPNGKVSREEINRRADVLVSSLNACPPEGGAA